MVQTSSKDVLYGTLRHKLGRVKFMQFRSIRNLEFTELKSEIESYPRLCGYYLVDMVSVDGLPEESAEREAFLDELFQYFDDHQWPPLSERPTDQS